MPSRPGPVCADSTGPISLTIVGGVPKTSVQRSISRRHSSGALMCWAAQASAPESLRWRA